MARASSLDREIFIKKAAEKAENSFWGYLGCELVSLEEQSVEIKLHVKPYHLNLAGILHGGVHATLLDSAMGLLTMAAYPEDNMVTTNLSLHYVAPVKEEEVTVYAHFIHQSHSIMTMEGKLVNSQGDLCAFATGSFKKA